MGNSGVGEAGCEVEEGVELAVDRGEVGGVVGGEEERGDEEGCWVGGRACGL